jgi:hypothetical protein
VRNSNAAKNDRTGRSQGEGHWTKMDRKLMETPAWRALSTTAQALYPWLRFEWRGGDYGNNGLIRLSTRQAAKAMGVGINAAASAFHSLQEKGFIAVTEPGALGLDGVAKGPAFEITEIALPKAREGRRLYQTWAVGRDFPIHQTKTNNPEGRNGKQNPVIKMKTRLSSK